MKSDDPIRDLMKFVDSTTLKAPNRIAMPKDAWKALAMRTGSTEEWCNSMLCCLAERAGTDDFYVTIINGDIGFIPSAHKTEMQLFKELL